MSHTTTINSIVISSEAAIRAAVARLAKQGIQVSLLENGIPRAYYPNQAGMSTPAEFLVRCDAAKYDIALYKNGKVYEPRTDLFAGHVASVFGATGAGSHDPAACIGKFTQAYGIEAAKIDAMRRGLSVREVQNGETVKLVLTGASL